LYSTIFGEAVTTTALLWISFESLLTTCRISKQATVRIILYVVATCTSRSSHISNARFTHSLLLAVSLAAGRRSAPRDRYDGHSYCASIRCYLLVSGSVRVRRGVVGQLGLGLGLGLALGLQLGIGIGFRRNHSWSSIFTPRHNHSLCLYYKTCCTPLLY